VKLRGTFLAGFAVAGAILAFADEAARFKVDVDMVVLSFTVTDDRGNYVAGLTKNDVRILEDGVAQNVTQFGESRQASRVAADNVFVLMDTSNCMYDQIPYAQDAVVDFVRRLPAGDAVAVYSFSRNMFRNSILTDDRERAIASVRNPVAGDDTAVFNALLLTLRDAARAPGHKEVVLFSNGPDNASMVAPDDVARVAREEGIPIYIISTRETNPLTTAAFTRLSDGTGGKLYVARDWKQRTGAFEAVRRDLESSYVVAYYPQPNRNPGFRKIDVEIVAENGRKLQVHCRPGYLPRSGAPGLDSASSSSE
jgi:VWFA-related protein